MRRLAFVLVLLFVSLPLSALRTGDTEVILPVVIRAGGAAGITWYTDILLANHYSPSHPVTLVFHPAGAAPIERSVTIPPYGMVALRDAVQTAFGLSRGTGQVAIRSTIGIALEARARVYGMRLDGRQVVTDEPGLGIGSLRRQAFVYGLRGDANTRINVGVSNPADVATTVTVRVTDANGALLYTQTAPLAARQTRQIADIFGSWSIPLQDVQVEIYTSSALIYGFAFEVRTDTQDVTFIFGTSPNA